MMNSKLRGIQEFVQQVAEVIAEVLKLEVSIFDEQLNLIAATGKVYGKGSLTEHIINKGGYLAIENPGFHPFCKNCQQKPGCKYSAVLVCPIEVEDKIIGSVGLTANNPEQRKHMIFNLELHLSFITKICVLLASAIKEKEMVEKIATLKGQFESVINSVHEGIIATDGTGVVNQINKSGLRLPSSPSRSSRW